mmetsp:Transcript_59593/g.98832  ORF Transcript_59593/g.98832 Transcript_59593/m.98832 type:complete len:87 (+) Transcript_59593:1-261(+)
MGLVFAVPVSRLPCRGADKDVRVYAWAGISTSCLSVVCDRLWKCPGLQSVVGLFEQPGVTVARRGFRHFCFGFVLSVFLLLRCQQH